MARGRHVRRLGLVAWLLSLRRPQPSWRSVHAQSLLLLGDDLRALDDEVTQLRAAEERSTAAAVMAELRAERLERELAAVRGEVASLRDDLAGVREELVWAFAERRFPVEARRADTRADAPRVVDLTRAGRLGLRGTAGGRGRLRTCVLPLRRGARAGTTLVR